MNFKLENEWAGSNAEEVEPSSSTSSLEAAPKKKKKKDKKEKEPVITDRSGGSKVTDRSGGSKVTDRSGAQGQDRGGRGGLGRGRGG